MDIFCKIVKKEIPSNIVYEDEIVMVVMDVNPRGNGHLLIIPKEHFTDLIDIDSNVLNHIMIIAKKMMNLLIEKLNCDGFTLENNIGISQEIKHFHLHIIPTYKKINKTININDIYNKLKEVYYG